MELRQLSYLVETARAGSFSRAAAELHLAQPSLSNAIAQLESELGIQLFERTSRGVTPTAAGVYIVRQSEHVLQGIEDLRDTARALALGTAGQVSLGVAPSLSWQALPDIIRAFANALPTAEVSVRDANAAAVIELIIEGSVDVGLVATASSEHLAEYYRGRLEVEHLGTLELIAALPRRYANSPDPIRLADFAHEPIAIPPPSTRTFGLRSGMLRAFEEAGLPQPRVRDVPSLFESIPLVMAGIAAAILPTGMKAAISSSDLVLRTIIDGPAPLEISLLQNPRHTSPTIARFAEIVREVLLPGSRTRITEARALRGRPGR